MSSQLFKTEEFPNQLLNDFLVKTCIKNEHNQFVFDRNAFKKGIFFDLISKFLADSKPHYHKAKHYYLERKITYNFFTTVIRQICNRNQIEYTTKINYSKSRYEIAYLISI